MASLTPRFDQLAASNNIIINGGMDFWQRVVGATTSVAGSSTAYTADRWRLFNSSSTGLSTITRDTDVPDALTAGYRSQYSMRINCTTAGAQAATGFSVLRYTVEGYDIENVVARKAMLSFWVKTSAAGIYCVALNPGQNSYQMLLEYTISAGQVNTWQKINIPIDFTTVDTTKFNYDNTVGMNLDFALSVGSNRLSATKNAWITTGSNVQGTTTQSNFCSSTANTLWLTQISLVTGDFDAAADIPFRRCGRNYAHELILCQRYYEKSYPPETALASNITSIGWGQAWDNSTLTRLFTSNVNYRATKRVIPTPVVYSEDGTINSVSVYNNSAVKIAVANVNQVSINHLGNFIALSAAATGITAGTPNVPPIVYVFHWAVDADY